MRRIDGPCYEPRRDDQGKPVVGMPSKGDYYLAPSGHVHRAVEDFETFTLPHPAPRRRLAHRPDRRSLWESHVGNIFLIRSRDWNPAEEECFRRWLRLVTVEVAESGSGRLKRRTTPLWRASAIPCRTVLGVPSTLTKPRCGKGACRDGLFAATESRWYHDRSSPCQQRPQDGRSDCSRTSRGIASRKGVTAHPRRKERVRHGEEESGR